MDQADRERGLLVLSDANGMFQFLQELAEPLHRVGDQRSEGLAPTGSPTAVVLRGGRIGRPFGQFGIELEKPRQTVGTLETSPALLRNEDQFSGHPLLGEVLIERRSGAGSEVGAGEFAGQASEQPVSVHRGMPVVAAVEDRRQVPG